MEIEIEKFVEVLNCVRITHAELKKSIHIEFENGISGHLYVENGRLKAELNWNDSKQEEIDKIIKAVDDFLDSLEEASIELSKKY